MSTKHTPLEVGTCNGEILIMDASGSAVMTITQGSMAFVTNRACPDREAARAFADSVVAVVNAYPALVAACHNQVSVIEQLIPDPSARGVADVVLEQARAALELAGEEVQHGTA